MKEMVRTINRKKNLVRYKHILHGERLPYNQRHNVKILLYFKVLNRSPLKNPNCVFIILYGYITER